MKIDEKLYDYFIQNGSGKILFAHAASAKESAWAVFQRLAPGMQK